MGLSGWGGRRGEERRGKERREGKEERGIEGRMREGDGDTGEDEGIACCFVEVVFLWRFVVLCCVAFEDFKLRL